MPEDVNANAPVVDAGQAEQAITETAPVDTKGQAGDIKTEKGQAPAPSTEEVERFLTLDDVPEDVRDHVAALVGRKEKEMQAAFTRKTQAIAKERQKIELVNAFEANPVDMLTRVAQQYGMEVVKQGQARQQAPVQAGPLGPDWQPETWDQVLDLAETRAEERILKKLQPVLAPLMQNVEKIRSNEIEQSLEKIDPNWHLYEDEIKESIKLAPSLIQTPQGIEKLYRMSVPADVLTSRATQTALSKFQAKAKAAQVESKSHATKTSPEYQGGGSFDDAVQAAKRQLSQT